VGPRAGLDDVKKRKSLTPPELELRPLVRPACTTNYAIRAPTLRITFALKKKVTLRKENSFRIPHGHIAFDGRDGGLKV
jgi:hypothetical protein